MHGKTSLDKFPSILEFLLRRMMKRRQIIDFVGQFSRDQSFHGGKIQDVYRRIVLAIARPHAIFGDAGDAMSRDGKPIEENASDLGRCCRRLQSVSLRSGAPLVDLSKNP